MKNSWNKLDRATKWTISVSIVIAVVGALFSYFHFDKRITQTVTDSPYSTNVIGDNNNVQTTSWSLTGGQQSTLEKALSANKGKVFIVSKIQDYNSENFANQLSDTFSKAGWEINVGGDSTLLQYLHTDIVVHVYPGSNKELEEQAELVCSTLNQIAISCGSEHIEGNQFITVTGQMATDTVYVFVGH